MPRPRYTAPTNLPKHLIVEGLDARFQRDYIGVVSNMYRAEYKQYFVDTKTFVPAHRDDYKHSKCGQFIVDAVWHEDFVPRVLEYQDSILLRLYYPGKTAKEVLESAEPEFKLLHEYTSDVYDEVSWRDEMNIGPLIPFYISDTAWELAKKFKEMKNAHKEALKEAKYELVSSFFHGTQHKSGSEHLWKIGARYSQEGIRRSIAEYAFVF
jgi:hypothetical protein